MTMRQCFLGLVAAAATMFASPVLAQEALKLTLNWQPGPYHEMFFYGKALGYYADEGIDLTIEPGRGSSATIQLVGAGNAEVGMAGGVAIFDLASKGAPVKIIMAIR